MSLVKIVFLASKQLNETKVSEGSGIRTIILTLLCLQDLQMHRKPSGIVKPIITVPVSSYLLCLETLVINLPTI